MKLRLLKNNSILYLFYFLFHSLPLVTNAGPRADEETSVKNVFRWENSNFKFQIGSQKVPDKTRGLRSHDRPRPGPRSYNRPHLERGQQPPRLRTTGVATSSPMIDLGYSTNSTSSRPSSDSKEWGTRDVPI